MGYDSARDLADRMISAKGRQITFIRPNEAAIDPITQAGSKPATTYVLRGIATPLSAAKAALIFGQGGSDINKRRLSVTVAMKRATGTPKIGDRFTWGGVPMRIITDPELLDPDGSGAPITAAFVAEAG